jgi:hypothetical protein
MLRQLDSSLWVNEVPFRLLGIDFGNRMTCIQLADNSFWLHSPTRYDRQTYDEVTGLGKIKYLITPSLMHNLFIMDWKQQDTSAQILAPAKAKKVDADINMDGMPEQELNALFLNEISCIAVNGIPMLQEYAFIHHASKTLILTDLAFNFGRDVKGWAGVFLKLYGAYNKFGPTITIRSLVRDKQAFRDSIATIAEQDFERIIVSHGGVVEQDGKEVFKTAFQKYLRT